MIKTTLPNTLISVSLLAIVGYSHTAWANTLTGTLGNGAGASDLYQVTCSTNAGGATYRLATQVSNTTASAPLMSVQANIGTKASNTTDAVSGDSNYSPWAYVNGGNGAYYVTVNKSGAGTASYSLQFNCETNTSAQTGTAVTALQYDHSLPHDTSGSGGSGGQSTFAPSDIKDQAYEGVTSLNALQIAHGCSTGLPGANGKEIVNPVIAQSVVFPTNGSDSTSYRSDTGDQTNLSDVISNARGLAGLAAPIQDISTFAAQDVKLDNQGNVIGFHSFRGKLQTNLLGRIPFLFTAPAFQPNTCVKRLLVKIAVADICKRSNTPVAGDVNLWIPNTTDKFADGALVKGSDGTPRSGLPATLTVNRTSTLSATCDEGGIGNGDDTVNPYDVTVWPSNATVDTNLPIPKYWLQ